MRFNKLVLIPHTVYSELGTSAGTEDLLCPEKIKTLSRRDLILYVNLNRLMGKATGVSYPYFEKVRDPDLRREITSGHSLKEAQMLYSEYYGHTELDPTTLKVIPLSSDCLGLIVTGKLSINRECMAGLANAIVNDYGFEVLKSLNNGDFLKKMVAVA